MKVDEAIKNAEELTPGAIDHRDNLNAWQVKYFQDNLIRVTVVKGDTIHLVQWLEANLRAIIISIQIIAKDSE